MEWISVEDRLPEENANVDLLISIGGDVFLTAYYMGGHFEHVCERRLKMVRDGAVTHWAEIDPPGESK